MTDWAASITPEFAAENPQKFLISALMAAGANNPTVRNLWNYCLRNGAIDFKQITLDTTSNASQSLSVSS